MKVREALRDAMSFAAIVITIAIAWITVSKQDDQKFRNDISDLQSRISFIEGKIDVK
jgi:hypothetical protein